MKRNIITISREHCTGGLDIARKVAQDLNIPFYDKELITLAAKESGLSEEAQIDLLHTALYAKGHTDLTIRHIKPGVEDCFMYLDTLEEHS